MSDWLSGQGSSQARVGTLRGPGPGGDRLREASRLETQIRSGARDCGVEISVSAASAERASQVTFACLDQSVPQRPGYKGAGPAATQCEASGGPLGHAFYHSAAREEPVPCLGFGPAGRSGESAACRPRTSLSSSGIALGLVASVDVGMGS